MITPPLHEHLDAAQRGGGGRIDRLFHRWLSALRKNALQFSSVDVDTGSTPGWRGSFTISDPEINEASRLLVIAKPDTENALEPIRIVRTVQAAGSAVVHWEADSGVGFSLDVHGQIVATRLGKVRDTRTFFYAVSG